MWNYKKMSMVVAVEGVLELLVLLLMPILSIDYILTEDLTILDIFRLGVKGENTFLLVAIVAFFLLIIGFYIQVFMGFRKKAEGAEASTLKGYAYAVLISKVAGLVVFGIILYMMFTDDSILGFFEKDFLSILGMGTWVWLILEIFGVTVAIGVWRALLAAPAEPAGSIGQRAPNTGRNSKEQEKPIIQQIKTGQQQVAAQASNALQQAKERVGQMQNNKSGSITCITGIYQGQTIPMADGETITIGRSATDSNLILQGTKLSRKHCSVTYRASARRYVVVDFSSNGTYLENGNRLTELQEIEMKPGTRIYLGNEGNTIQLG